jgi:2-oxoisovalerate dehydrogenase E1 component alpha subunit
MLSRQLHRIAPRGAAAVRRFCVQVTANFDDYAGKNTRPAPEESWSTDLTFQNRTQQLPCYRVMDLEGQPIDKEPKMDEDLTLKIYETMVKLNVMDKTFYEAQRQGRITFYMTSFGEEGSVVASAAALDDADAIFSQYREQGSLMWRGWSIADFANQCASNVHDAGKGRQMPVHYGDRSRNFITVSSPLATQIPHAAGAGYAYKLMGKKICALTYYGEGAASEGDYHAAVNFAATLDCPTVFFCRNNHYAISTNSDDQYAGEGTAPRGLAYGVDTIRVDGNDVFAVYEVTKAAREKAVKEQKPVMIEAMSYRVGHHSTSDDSTRYRSMEEIKAYEAQSPILRLQKYLKLKDWYDEGKWQQFEKDVRAEAVRELVKAEKEDFPHHSELFNDVYDTIPTHLREQQDSLKEHMERHPEHYNLK